MESNISNRKIRIEKMGLDGRVYFCRICGDYLFLTRKFNLMHCPVRPLDGCLVVDEDLKDISTTCKAGESVILIRRKAIKPSAPPPAPAVAAALNAPAPSSGLKSTSTKAVKVPAPPAVPAAPIATTTTKEKDKGQQIFYEKQERLACSKCNATVAYSQGGRYLYILPNALLN